MVSPRSAVNSFPPNRRGSDPTRRPGHQQDSPSERARPAPLKAEMKARLDAVAELKGKLDAVLTLLGQRELKSAEVVDLPDWRKRDVA